MPRQRVDQRPRRLFGHARDCRGEIKTRDWRRVLVRQANQLAQNRGRRFGCIGTKLNRPAAHVFVGVSERLPRHVVRPGSDGVQRPERRKPAQRIGISLPHLEQRGLRLRLDCPRLRALVQQAASGANKPLVLVAQQSGQFDIALAGEVHLFRMVGRGIFDAVNSAVAPVPAFSIRVVAVLPIIPVNHINRAIGAVLQVHRHVPRVAAKELVAPGVDRVEAGAEPAVNLVIDLVPAEVVGEEMAAVPVGPVVAKVNHRADVRVASVDFVAARFARATGAVIVARRSEQVVAEPGEILGRIRDDKGRVVCVGLVPIVAALDHVGGAAKAPIAAAVSHENLAALVVIEAPLIAAAVREHLELSPHRMIPPHARAQFDALIVRRARFTDVRGVEHALVSVEPAVRPPQETVQALVRVLETEALEQHLRWP